MGNAKTKNETLNLKPQDRLLIIESFLKSIDNPDKEIGEIWAEENEKYRIGQTEYKWYVERNIATLNYKFYFMKGN